MAELREGIDALDTALVDLLAVRAGYIDRAIALKQVENLPARTVDRVEEVIANVRRLAADRDLDPALAETLWREVIEWSIAREARILER
jgi:isochorismate pyruvate lyase